MDRWEPADEFVDIGRWRADPRADELRAGATVVKLEPLKMRLLLVLAERPGEVVLTTELLDRVWGDVIVTSSSVYQGIAQLRRVLDEPGSTATAIETVPRKGYRLVAPVSREPRPDPAPASRPGDLVALLPLSAVAPDTAGSALPAATTLLERTSVPGSHRRAWLMGGLALGGATALGFVAWRGFRTFGTGPLPVRIAVLPFVDKTPAAGETALSQTLALDVIRAMERHPDLLVTAPASAIAAASGHSLEEAARLLEARLVVSGTVEPAGRGVRVTVRLLRMPGSSVRWERTFEQTAADLSLLPDAIAASSVAALGLNPAPGAPDPAAAAAYELYALGNLAWQPRTPEAFARARQYYERGIEADAGYARNYVGVAFTWIGQASNGGGLEYEAAFARAAPLFEKALRLDPASAEALTGQGMALTAAAQFDEARALLRRAISLRPSYAQAVHSMGVAEFADGWPQRAAVQFQRAAELNPLGSAAFDRLGAAAVASGQLATAEAAYRREIALEPGHPNGHWGLGIKAYAEGALDVAVTAYREALKREPRRPFLWSELAYLFLDLGASSLAEAAFQQAQALLPDSTWPGTMAGYAWLVRPDRGVAPPALSLQSASAPEDLYVIDVLLIRAMAGLPLDEVALQQALDLSRSRDRSVESQFWFVFLGFNALVDLATIYSVLGKPDKGRPYLLKAQGQLDRYERQGNVWHALHFHRARLLALRGEPDAALVALTAAVAAGCRRGWRLRLDPAFEPLRVSPKFSAALARIDQETVRQRLALGL